MPADDERRLILDAQEGSREAFRLLVERHMKQAYNIAYGVVGDHEEAEDIAQESFVRVYHSLRSFRREASFSTWLYRIVMNLSINRYRQKKTREKHELRMEADHAALWEDQPIQPEVHVPLEQALHRLPTLQRAVVILRHMNGLSTKQVGSILDCSEGTVKTHLHRGLRKMKTMLDFLKAEGLA